MDPRTRDRRHLREEREGWPVLLAVEDRVDKPERSSRRRTKAPGSPPGGQVRQADTERCPRGGTPPVRLATPTVRQADMHLWRTLLRRVLYPKTVPRAGPARLRQILVVSGPMTSATDPEYPTTSGSPKRCLPGPAPNTPKRRTSRHRRLHRLLESPTRPRGLRTDWAATWRNWMRREQVSIGLRHSFRGTPVQTVVKAVATRSRSAEEMCRYHRGHRARTCGLCHAERIAADRQD
ncbi:hypothetical protein EDD30_1044 [Couchioplanes caeruleus]|uniref:Uncharacterized protein n=1 Tax=Couchioplanes caeruleus TaxID=56438 RepID=A0A3N1GDE5_9ACTN|nr:hypothetical protein EDD30_1044 [Couchioplanes caeruleus]